jgi:hypothetical protein
MIDMLRNDGVTIFKTKTNTDTLLHLALHHFTSIDDLFAFMQTVDKYYPDYLTEMSIVTNNDGRTPIRLIFDLKNIEDRIKIRDFLLPVVCRKNTKKMTDKISFKEIKKQYVPEKNSDLYANLKLACHIVNKSSGLYKFSNTHPQINGSDSFFEVRDKVQQLRNTINQNKRQLLSNFKKADSAKKRYELLMDNQLESEKNALGNCHEQAYSALNLIDKYEKKRNKHMAEQDKKPLSAGIYSFKHGDHAFAVIDPHGSAVVCDLWSRVVCPIKNMPSAVYDFDSLYAIHNGKTVHYNFLSTFNPAFHVAKPRSLFFEYKQKIKKTANDTRIYVPENGKSQNTEAPELLRNLSFESEDGNEDANKKLNVSGKDKYSVETIQHELLALPEINDLPLLFFLFITELGKKLLSEFAIREKITSDSLNAASRCLELREQILKSLKKYPDLCSKISKNTIEIVFPEKKNTLFKEKFAVHKPANKYANKPANKPTNKFAHKPRRASQKASAALSASHSTLFSKKKPDQNLKLKRKQEEEVQDLPQPKKAKR